MLHLRVTASRLFQQLIIPSQVEMIYTHPIICDIHHLLRKVSSWKIHFVYRDANRAAHMLAKLACNLVEDQIWIEHYPYIVTELIQVEKLHVHSVIE